MNIKYFIIIVLLIEGIFLFFTTKEEQKLKTTRAYRSSLNEGFEEVKTFHKSPILAKRVDIDLNKEPEIEVEKEVKTAVNTCPDEFTFELYSHLDEEAPSQKKNWNYTVKNGIFKYKNKRLKAIPTSISFEPCFKGLDFSSNRLTKFPSELEEVTHLNILNLSNNRITKINSIGNFSNLEDLDLSMNKIIRIDDNIASLKKLKYLNLKSNYNLAKISERIFELKGTLKVLNIRNTQFTKNKQTIEKFQKNLPNTEIIY